jgi:hypothetical protein
MRNIKVCLLLALAALALPQAAKAQMVRVTMYAFEECSHNTYSPELRSGCFTVPEAAKKFSLQGIGAQLPPKEVEDKIYPVPASLSSKVQEAEPVFKKQGRRLLNSQYRAKHKQRFVPVQTSEGKALLDRYRQMHRNISVSVVQAIIGFLVPWPASIIVGAVACAGVQTMHDAHEYRQDYREEPTGEQYQASFSSNLGYCSGITQIREAKNPLQFLAAVGSFFLPFLKTVPPAVTYAQQGLSLVQMAGARAQAPAVAQKRQRQAPQVAQVHPKKQRTAAHTP